MSTRPLPERAFMIPWHEDAHEDIEDVAERWVDDGHDDGASETIEEYTVRDRRWHLPSAESLIDYLEECAWDNEAGENVEYSSSPKVLALAEELMRTMSDEGSGWMCGDLVATHTIEIRGRQPHLDGEPFRDPLPDHEPAEVSR